jgi:hypothetical protein
MPQSVRPVRIARGAFGPGVPARALLLSPDHAVFADGVLIPVKGLINGVSVAQVARDEVVYWHVELDRHDVLFAEGLSCESYLDTGDRPSFENGGAAALHADHASRVREAEGCAPLHVVGPTVAAVRRRVDARVAIVARAGAGRVGSSAKARSTTKTTAMVSMRGRPDVLTAEV